MMLLFFSSVNIKQSHVVKSIMCIFDFVFHRLFFLSDPAGLLPCAVTVGYMTNTNQQGSNDVHRGIRHAEDRQVCLNHFHR